MQRSDSGFVMTISSLKVKLNHNENRVMMVATKSQWLFPIHVTIIITFYNADLIQHQNVWQKLKLNNQHIFWDISKDEGKDFFYFPQAQCKFQ